MGMKVRGLDGLGQRIEQAGERVVRRARERMKRVAEKIALTAQDNAPVDTHNLENEIRVHKRYDGGNHGRLVIDVGVVDAPDKVATYAMEMHESLSPHGGDEYRLGPGSLAKRAAGKDVGGKYLERAAEKHDVELEKEMTLEVERSWDL